MRYAIGLAVLLVAGVAHGQMSVEEAQKRMEERRMDRPPDDELSRLREENRRLRARIAVLEREIAALKAPPAEQTVQDSRPLPSQEDARKDVSLLVGLTINEAREALGGYSDLVIAHANGIKVYELGYTRPGIAVPGVPEAGRTQVYNMSAQVNPDGIITSVRRDR